MLDYPAIEALLAIIETQSFQGAAEKLFVTQSAISQRIKSLEIYYGEPILIRTLPYRPTRLGSQLLNHFRRTVLLENELNDTLKSSDYKQRISIAVSRDSLETWFAKIMEQLKKLMPFTLEVVADDQDVTISYLQNGLVSACASTQSKGISGCKVDFLGFLDYVLVAAPDFKKKFFSGKKVTENLTHAPAIVFDNKDNLHSKYLKHFFAMDDTNIQYHVMPSVAGFRQFAVNGYAYALIPEIDILSELKQKQLIKLFPDKIWAMPVYWHRWEVETQFSKSFNELVFNVSKKILRQK